MSLLLNQLLCYIINTNLYTLIIFSYYDQNTEVGLDGTCDSTDSATDQCSVADTECRNDGAGTDKCLCETTFYPDGGTCVTSNTHFN